MADTTTTTYSLVKPEIGASTDSGGLKWNTNLDSIDNLLNGATAITPNLTAGSWKISGTAITATAAQINVLSGISAGLTAAEINVLDGVTATTSEINVLSGVTATTSQINSSPLIGTLPVMGALAQGSVVVGNSSSVASAVAIGTSGTVLKSNGTTATWGDDRGLPAGTVIHTATASAPAGFLKANGAAVSRSTYSDLFSAIGTTFGVGNGSSTFNVPDLRGEFLRGWDDGRGADGGRSFGSAQSDQNKLHGHEYTICSDNNGGSGTDGGFVTRDIQTSTVGPATGSASTSAGSQIGASGGAEARPRNIALLACIKF